MPLLLPDVTLFAATSVANEATVGALHASMDQARFGRVMLFSDRAPPGLEHRGIEHCAIPPMRSKADYSCFILHDLAEYITTTHALCVQWDGFVLNGEAWEEQFLDFDYIGAPWPHFRDGHNVGNGGFSLRSRRLMSATASLPYDGTVPEDVLIGRVHRDRLEAQGLRFAPEELAKRFSFERAPPSGGEFGFHGAFNLAKILPHEQLFSILESLEPQVLTASEHKELLRWAVRNRYAKIAALLMGRIWRQRTKNH